MFSNGKIRSMAVLFVLTLTLAMFFVATTMAATSVSLESPSDNTVTMDNEPDFRFTVTSSVSTVSCTLWLQAIPSGTPTSYGTNGSVVSGFSTAIRASSPIPNGQYQWWINCSDGINAIISQKLSITINVIRGDQSFTASFDGSTRYYWLDIPDNFEKSTSTPLVLFLHGYGGDRYSYSQKYPVLRQVFQNHTWIVAAVDCRDNDWYIEPTRRDITDVLNNLTATYHIDSGHVHVMGNSMGGGGALKYAMFNNEVIASLVDINGISNFTQFYIETTTYKASLAQAYGGTPSQVPGVYANESALGNEYRFRHTPVMILHGSADTTVNVSQSRSLNQSLSALGYAVKYVEVPGASHDAQILISGREMEIFNWFNDHPLWGSTHLLLSVQPNQVAYSKGESVSLAVTVFNQLNPSLDSTLTLTVTGPGGYSFYDFQPISVAANSLGEYSFTWSAPNTAGTYVVEIGLAPSLLTVYDAKWLDLT